MFVKSMITEIAKLQFYLVALIAFLLVLPTEFYSSVAVSTTAR